jgi:putative lipoic acid-binding regulatory protein
LIDRDIDCLEPKGYAERFYANFSKNVFNCLGVDLKAKKLDQVEVKKHDLRYTPRVLLGFCGVLMAAAPFVGAFWLRNK